MIFIDWLTIYQEHVDGGLPVVGKEYRVSHDLATGEKVFELVTGWEHEGSHDTRLRVRCDGRRVEVSGNPSGFSRPDNLFGFTSMTDCVAVYNEVLESLGLPAFVNPSRPAYSKTGYQFGHSDSLIWVEKPTITRVDLTENLESPNGVLYLRSLSGYVHQGRVGHLYEDGLTLEWNGKKGILVKEASKRVYIKYYIKETDIIVKQEKLKKKFRKDTSLSGEQELLERHGYLESVRGYCRDKSLVRHEVTFKAKYLSQHGMNHIENWSQDAMTNIIRPYQFHKRLKVEQSSIKNTVEQLLIQGIELRQANRADIVFNAWIQGKNLHYKAGGLSKSEYYRMRNILLLVGVDISLPCQIAHLPLQSIKMTVNPVDPPEWYQMPTKAKMRLSLVA